MCLAGTAVKAAGTVALASVVRLLASDLVVNGLDCIFICLCLRYETLERSQMVFH